MDETEAVVAVCAVCKKEEEIQHSLSLTKDKGVWKSNPICADCCKKLTEVARVEGEFIPFFRFDVSEREAEKRNKNVLTYAAFLKDFSRPRREVKSFVKKTKPNLRVASEK